MKAHYLTIALRILLYLHIAFIFLVYPLNYIDPFFDSECFTIRGDVILIPDTRQPMPVEPLKAEAEPAFLMKNSGFARLDYCGSWSALLSVKNIFYILINWIWILMGLAITWLLYSIARTVVRNRVFSINNINRMKWIALLLLMIALARFAADLLFASIAMDNIYIDGYSIAAHGIMYQSHLVLFAVLVFVLVHIYKTGLQLQTEQDLTI